MTTEFFISMVPPTVTHQEKKITAVNGRLHVYEGPELKDARQKLTAYLSIAKSEILAWIYHLVGGAPDDVMEVPSKYDMTHIYAVVVGYTQAGTEGQSVSVENGVHRHFNYTDMLDYIHNNVLPFVRVGAIT